MLDSLLVPVDIVLQAGVDLPQAGGRSLLTGGLSSFFTTLIVGALLVAIVPDYTERMVAAAFDDPLSSFLYGFGALVGLLVVSVLLVLTLVGILVAVPLLVVAYVVWAVGATIAFLALSDRLVSRDDSWLKPLLVAAALNGGLALTGIGGLVSLVVGAVGVGSVLRDYLA